MPPWPLVSVLITGYRRPEQLRIAVESFRDVNDYENVELILADDGSPPELQRQMRQLPIDKFVFAERNRGLGANTNAGLRAAAGDYILQLQDDWICSGPGDFLYAGIEVMRSRRDIGMVRLTDRDPAIPFDVCLVAGRQVRICPPAPQLYVYSDNPHLKSAEFIEFIGPYEEGRSMARTELKMRNRFNRQSRYVAVFVEGYDLFTHIGEDVSHRNRLPLARVGRLMDRTPGLRLVARAYRRSKRILRPWS